MGSFAQTRKGESWLLCLCCLVVPTGALYAPGAALPDLDRALAHTSVLRLRGGARPSSWFAKAATMPSVTPTSATVDAMKCLGNWSCSSIVLLCLPARERCGLHASRGPCGMTTNSACCRYVQVAVPTPFDTTAHNGLEQYTWDEEKQRIKVKYTFNDGSFTGKETIVYQKGRVNPESKNGARWQVRCAAYVRLRVVSDIETESVRSVAASPPVSVCHNTAGGGWTCNKCPSGFAHY